MLSFLPPVPRLAEKEGCAGGREVDVVPVPEPAPEPVTITPLVDDSEAVGDWNTKDYILQMSLKMSRLYKITRNLRMSWKGHQQYKYSDKTGIAIHGDYKKSSRIFNLRILIKNWKTQSPRIVYEAAHYPCHMPMTTMRKRRLTTNEKSSILLLYPRFHDSTNLLLTATPLDADVEREKIVGRRWRLRHVRRHYLNHLT